MEALILFHQFCARGFAILGLLLVAYLLAVGGNALWEYFNRPDR